MAVKRDGDNYHMKSGNNEPCIKMCQLGNEVIGWGLPQWRGEAGGCGLRPEKLPLLSQLRVRLQTTEKMSPRAEGGKHC